MKIYKVRYGTPMSSDTFFVRGKSIAQALPKISKRANRYDYVDAADILSIELLGEEEA